MKSVRRHSLQARMTAIFAVLLAIILLINLFIYLQINNMVSRIDRVFSSNVTITELSDQLQLVEGSVTDYLNTKSSQALENYYRYAEKYKDLSSQLNRRNTDNQALMLEKNIRSMSTSYLETADATIQAKRGRNVELYRELYNRQQQIYQYINYYIYELNSLQFARNSQNYQSLLDTMHILEIICASIVIASSLIGLLLAVMIIRAMFRPLTMLADKAMIVAGGDMDVELEETDSQDEIGILTTAFAQMLQSIRSYIDRVRSSMANEAAMKERELSMEAHLREAQLKFLQAQINPHFLFNSLNAGAQLAMMEDADQTGEFLEKMADFFRYNVKKTDGVSTLREEIDAVDNYIYILNVRFAGDITYRKETDDACLDIKVPSMFLQPLVENAVTHGIREMMGRGEITLTAVQEENGVHLLVTDNGAGMSSAQIAEIMSGSSKTKEDDRESTGIGLRNVMTRLALFYGKEGLVTVSSAGKGCGSEVSVFLPGEEAK